MMGERSQPTVADFMALRYVMRCVNESMRLYPHPPVLLRRAQIADTLPGARPLPCPFRALSLCSTGNSARQPVQQSAHSLPHLGLRSFYLPKSYCQAPSPPESPSECPLCDIKRRCRHGGSQLQLAAVINPKQMQCYAVLVTCPDAWSSGWHCSVLPALFEKLSIRAQQGQAGKRIFFLRRRLLGASRTGRDDIGVQHPPQPRRVGPPK